jgi:uncharacterized membrane-anchored protein YhcB (DUF1043 family)
MSDTPRTDEAKWETAPAAIVVSIYFAQTLERENAALREQLAASRQEVEVQKAKADKHYELGTEYFDLMVKAEREIAGLQKLLKRSATYIVDYPLNGQRDRIFLNQIDAALNKIDAVITATDEVK